MQVTPSSTRYITGTALTSLLATLTLTAGCLVPQPPGKGRIMHRIEPSTGRGYWLYLPADYLKFDHPTTQKRWPVVVTFHGMKPFDNAEAQAREWQYEADNYGLIVIAPELLTADLLMEFPLRHVRSYLRADERAVVAIMYEVFATTDSDPTRVLATSWSSGGYVAHYMVNRHPRLFSCLAPRQSNFSASILDAAMAPLYRDMPIGIFFGENDFPICRKESIEAVKWYRQHGFKHVQADIVLRLGHERTPQTAAAFFAKYSSPPINPVRPALARATLARLRLQPATFAGLSTVPIAASPPAPRPSAQPSPVALGPTSPPAQARTTPAGPAGKSGPNRPAPEASGPPANPTRIPSAPARRSAGRQRIRIFVSTRLGVAPLLVSFGLKVPPDLAGKLDCLWLDDGEPICSGLTGQKILIRPGTHTIAALIVTRDNHEIRLQTTVKVLPRNKPAYVR